MIETTKPTSSKSLIKILAFVVAIILVLNALFFFLLIHFNPNLGYLIVDYKWKLLEEQKETVDLLVLGDSSGNQGFSVDEYKDQTGKDALNLCTIGPMLTLDDSWMLQKYIDKVGVPKEVLVIHAHDVWPRNFNKVLQSRIPLREIQSEKYKPVIPDTYQESFIYLLYKYLPMYSQRQSISQLIMHPQSYGHDLEFQTGGYMLWDEVDSLNTRSNFNEQINLVRSGSFQISKSNLEGIESMISLAEKYKFKLFLANSPEYELLWEDRDFQAYYKEMADKLNSICISSKYAKFISDQPELYGIDQLAGTDHIITESGPDYTRRLISKLN